MVISEGVGEQHGTIDQRVDVLTLEIVADHGCFVAALGQLPVEADEVIVFGFVGGEIGGKKYSFFLQEVIEDVGGCIFPSEIDKTAG